jgi:hypothetical protein
MKSTRARKMVILKREISGKRKVKESRMTRQHKAELKQGKDRWDITLNVPTGDGKERVMESTKPLWMH